MFGNIPKTPIEPVIVFDSAKILSALAEIYVQKKLIKFVAFDSPFDGNKNSYEDGIYRAIHQLNRIGIQTIITSNEDVIHNPENLLEIKNEYLTDYLSNDDKLMGDF